MSFCVAYYVTDRDAHRTGGPGNDYVTASTGLHIVWNELTNKTGEWQNTDVYVYKVHKETCLWLYNRIFLFF